MALSLKRGGAEHVMGVVEVKKDACRGGESWVKGGW